MTIQDGREALLSFLAVDSSCDVSRIEHLTLDTYIFDSTLLIKVFKKMPKLQKLELVYRNDSDWISVCEAVQAKSLKSFKCIG